VATISVPEPQWSAALRSCRSALRRIAAFDLDPALNQRLLDMGERKEFLQPDEQAELLALTAFTQQRTVEKLEAELALQRLDALFPDVDADP
jgi:hypothetical protein